MRLSFLILGLVLIAGMSYPAFDSNLSPSTDPIIAERLIPTGSMKAERASHTSTLLPNGEVLIVGGCTGRGCNPGDDAHSAERYNPASATFEKAGSMSGERAGEHTATLLLNGNVLLAGGWRNRRPTSSVDLFNAESNVFVETSPMHIARASHTATLLNNGKVLIVGGYDGENALSGVELYDPTTDSFEKTGSLIEPRAGHVALRLSDGRVLVIGGGDTYQDIVLASAEIYDPDAGTFSQTGSLSMVRHKHAASLLPDGRVLVIGGSDTSDFYGRYNSTEIYDPETGAFSEGTPMHSPRFKLPYAVVTLSTGDILVAGGDEQAEIYNPQTASFRQVEGSMDTERSFSAVTLLQNGDALVSGGYDEKIQLTNLAWIYRHE